MNTPTIIAAIALAAILLLAIRYIYKEKKKGKACIGCPYSDACPKNKVPGQSCESTAIKR